MINRKTVLVLGAGASSPYGLPLGAELRTRLLAMSEASLKKLPTGKSGHMPYIMSNFVQEFRRSQAYSIDSFLAHRKDYAELGKRAIAATLLPMESVRHLVDADPPDHWYRYLVNAMASTWQDLPRNQVSFVTFNYDRSLELFLMTTWMHLHNRSEPEALQMLANFPIVHVYGDLGSIDPSNKTQFVPYGGGQTEEERMQYVDIAAQRLLVIDEGRNDSAEFEKARQLIADADSLCFLGFAFDDTNVKRLGGSDLAIGMHRKSGDAVREFHFAATALGMKDAAITRVAGSICAPGNSEYVRAAMKNLMSLELLLETEILRT